MSESRAQRRRQFIQKMLREAIVSYDDTYKEWYSDEKELMPIFLSQVGSGKRVIDFAGGCGKAIPELLKNGNTVVLGDLSAHSLSEARKMAPDADADFVRFDMLNEPPFVENAFDGIWFAEAFEYVPPDARLNFLRSLRRTVKVGGIVFLSAEIACKEHSRFKCLRNYLYWKLVKRAPVIWGEYIYWLDLPAYKGWHYHSLVLSRGIERTFREAGFEVVVQKGFGETEYASYILRAV